ncbi:Hydroxysteroid dehydrogenase-like protein 2 [Hypsibius exemplaris]|uniref:Hydroxysteroid dehydrogenase-like protein 2 n=1 Tax=Hypsibius exemplaris TaxID=2072580 RepID=A0A1W0X3Y7_HYPEX|nr:Hydroxysteroid dehydrogenase-like protein 2 [Hypsibius exemplaris]
MYNTGKLAGKTIFITGASRGIGKAIALKAAKDGANLVIAAKTATPHAKLEGTIFTAAKEIEAAGGRCLPVQVDVRDEDQVQKAVEDAVRNFGGIDILVNNASAISLTGTQDTTMKKYDLMNQVNARGTFLTSKLCIPYLKQSKNPHILNLSPPLSLNPIWFKGHVAYTMAKYGMSMCVLGMSEEFKDNNIAVNALWPRTAIWTAAVEMMAGDSSAKNCRKVDICADAFYVIVTKSSRDFTGNFCIDERVLRDAGVTDFDQYAVEKGNVLIMDGFVDEDENGQPNILSREESSNHLRSGFKSSGSAGPVGVAEISAVFSAVGETLKNNPDLKLDGLYLFDVEGQKWFIDGASRSIGKSGQAPPGVPLCTLSMKAKDFSELFSGSLIPTMAFLSGKVVVKGNMGSAIKLDKLLAAYQQNRKLRAA